MINKNSNHKFLNGLLGKGDKSRGWIIIADYPKGVVAPEMVRPFVVVVKNSFTSVSICCIRTCITQK